MPLELVCTFPPSQELFLRTQYFLPPGSSVMYEHRINNIHSPWLRESKVRTTWQRGKSTVINSYILYLALLIQLMLVHSDTLIPPNYSLYSLAFHVDLAVELLESLHACEALTTMFRQSINYLYTYMYMCTLYNYSYLLIVSGIDMLANFTWRYIYAAKISRHLLLSHRIYPWGLPWILTVYTAACGHV